MSGRSEGSPFGEGLHYGEGSPLWRGSPLPVKGQRGSLSPGGADGQRGDLRRDSVWLLRSLHLALGESCGVLREGRRSNLLWPPATPLPYQKPPAVDSACLHPASQAGPSPLEHPPAPTFAPAVPPQPSAAALTGPAALSGRKLPASAPPWPSAGAVLPPSTPVVQMVNFRKVPVPRPGLPALRGLSPGWSGRGAQRPHVLSTHGGSELAGRTASE